MTEPGAGEQQSVSASPSTSNPSKSVHPRLLPKDDPSTKESDISEKIESVDKFAIYDTDDFSLQEEIAKTPQWAELDSLGKTCYVVILILKVLAIFLLMYIFICSLFLLTTGFKIVGGKSPHKMLNKDIIGNPVVGLMCGVLITILAQSSSSTTTAIVGMVTAKIITVKVAIPIVMGANIGTSVTNTLLALMQVGDRNRFRLAFAAATIHDIFNFLTTIVLLPIESLTGYMQWFSDLIVSKLVPDSETNTNVNATYKPKFIKALTDPVIDKIVKADKNGTTLNKGHMFANSGWSNTAIGAVVIVLAFILLLSCLILLVKMLKSILKGKIALWIRRVSEAKLPYCPALTDYLLILMGAVLTFLVQSSSVFTSLLPPLVSVKALAIERAYSLTLGANIGTTTTALIAGIIGGDSNGLRIALCHLMFNISGVLLFFPIPFMRIPIRWAKILGNTTARYRWFAIVYIIVLFILMPVLFMGLAFAGSGYVIGVSVLLAALILFVIIVNSFRKYKRCMPEVLQTWNWLPVWCRSLEPYDKIFAKCRCCNCLTQLEEKQSRAPAKDNTEVPSETHHEETLQETVPGGSNDTASGMTEYVRL